MSQTSANYTKGIRRILGIYGPIDPKREAIRRRDHGDDWRNKPIRKPHAHLKPSLRTKPVFIRRTVIRKAVMP